MITRLLIRVGGQCRSYSLSSRCMKDLRFSETAAYHGLDKAKSNTAANLNEPLYIPNRYDSNAFKNKRALYAVLSVFGLGFYLALLREPNDIDVVLNAPPHLLTSNLERRMLREQINKARMTGQDSELLEAELAYVDVKEAAMRARYEKDSRVK